MAERGYVARAGAANPTHIATETILRHIRVASLEELKTRILKGIDEMNAYPLRFQWKNFDFQMT